MVTNRVKCRMVRYEKMNCGIGGREVMENKKVLEVEYKAMLCGICRKKYPIS
jgi:hypothetical protein